LLPVLGRLAVRLPALGWPALAIVGGPRQRPERHRRAGRNGAARAGAELLCGRAWRARDQGCRIDRGDPLAELGRRRAAGRIARQRGDDDRAQRVRQRVQVGRPVHDPVEDRLERAGSVRRPAGRRVGHRRAPGMHV
jgi:hypothetical protein